MFLKFWVVLVILVALFGLAMAQHPLSNVVTVEKCWRNDSGWSLTRGDTLDVVAAANDTSRDIAAFYCADWPVAGWCLATSWDSVSGEPVADTIRIQYRVCYEHGQAYTSWSNLDTIIGPYYAIPKATEYKAITIPSPKPEAIQFRAIAKDADSSMNMARYKVLSW